MPQIAQRIRLTLGTAGHIDHGKTALVRNLTGCETDRLREEQERGMSIELGFAPCVLGELQVGIVDVPGHEHFIRPMVAGATAIDAVIFVVAADDGPMPQTREHLDIITLLGVRAGVVALTKIDRVTPEELRVSREVLGEFLRGTFLESAPIIGVSNVNGEGFGELHTALRDMVARLQPRPADGVFRMPVERAFSVKGHGTVVTGVPVSGSIEVGAEVTLLPAGLTAPIKAAQVFTRPAQRAAAGQCTALNVRHWDHHAIERGQVVAEPGYFEPGRWLACRLELLPREGLFIRHAAHVRLHTGTSDVPARVYLLDRDTLEAGQSAFVQIRTEEPLIAGPRDHFIIRTLTPVQTVGGGTILELIPGRYRRHSPEIVADLAQRATALASNAGFVEYCIRTDSEPPTVAAALSRRVKLRPAALQAILAELVAAGRLVSAAGGWVHSEVAASLSERVAAQLAVWHAAHPDQPAATREELALSCGLSPAQFAVALELLKAAGTIRTSGERLALASHQPAGPSRADQLQARVEAAYRERPFAPPEAEELAAAWKVEPFKVTAAVRKLLETKILIRIAADVVLHREAIDKARTLLVEEIRQAGRLESVRFKYLLDTSRKYAIPLLDYFDRTGLTRRDNNTRYLR